MEDKEYYLFKDKFDVIFFGNRKWLFIVRLVYVSIFLTLWGFLYERKELYKVQFLGDDYGCWFLVFPLLFSLFLTFELANRRLLRWFLNFFSNFFTFWIWLKIYLAEKLYSEVIVDTLILKVFRNYTAIEKFNYCCDTWDYINLIYGETMAITLEEIHRICSKCSGMSGIFYYSLDLWREKKFFILEDLKKANVVDENFSFSKFIFEHISLSSLGNVFWVVVYFSCAFFFSYGLYKTLCPTISDSLVNSVSGPLKYPTLDVLQDIIFTKSSDNAQEALLLLRRLINDDGPEARVLLSGIVKTLFPFFNEVSTGLLASTRDVMQRTLVPQFEGLLMQSNDINVLDNVMFGPSKYPGVIEFITLVTAPEVDTAQESLILLNRLFKDNSAEANSLLVDFVKIIFPFFNEVSEQMVFETKTVFLKTLVPNLENLLMHANDYNINF